METVKTIIMRYLQDKGYDGLAGNGCGCGLNDFMLCDILEMNCRECRPAMRRKATEEDTEEFDCEVGGEIYVAVEDL